ncbi:MAG: peptide chain release factor N(5)-glutamine methyltransferase [Streptomycetaceae bacterium]|nr:MAG: peptide chain release factor N(5)-glutamine methyltransferase [Streptomycetaceae bacterium]
MDLDSAQLLQLEESFNELVTARLSGTPTQYLLGYAPFRYLLFDVGPGVLIPRPETELLVDAALVEIKKVNAETGRAVSVVDLGAGTGAIAVSVAFEAERHNLSVTVVAVEMEAAACKWLRQNIQKHDVEVRVIESSVETALIDVKCDLVIANPPYIPAHVELPKNVIDFEPHSALIGGATGIEVPTHFIDAARRILKSGGLFLIEHFETQGALIAQILSNGFNEIELHSDLTNRPRWTSARKL